MARRALRTTEPIIKSSGSDFFMLANAKHEIKFHGTIPLDSSSLEPCRTMPNGVPRCEEQPTASGKRIVRSALHGSAG